MSTPNFTAQGLAALTSRGRAPSRIVKFGVDSSGPNGLLLLYGFAGAILGAGTGFALEPHLPHAKLVGMLVTVLGGSALAVTSTSWWENATSSHITPKGTEPPLLQFNTDHVKIAAALATTLGAGALFGASRDKKARW